MLETLLVNLLNRLSRGRPGRPRDGLLIGRGRDDAGRAVEVRLPSAALAEHVMVLGKTGTGKTHLLQLIASEHMRRGEGFALLDYHGDCTSAVLALAAQHGEAMERLILIDPTDRQRSPGLNPLESRDGDAHDGFRRASELAAILRARWRVEAFGPRSEELLRNTLFTLAVNGLTLVEAPPLLTSAPFRAGCAARLGNADVASYWRDRFEPLSEAMKASFREPLLNKMTSFLVEPSSRHLLGQARSSIDLGDAMARGRWVLVNLSKGALGEHAHTLGNLVFAKLQFEAFGRIRLPPGRRRPFSIIVDEVQNLAENDLVTLLAEGRKFGVGLVTANQYWEQLPRELRGALLAAGTQVIFRVSHADATALAPELAAKGHARYAEQLTSLPRGEAIVRIGHSSPIRVRVGPLPKQPASARAIEALRTSAQTPHSKPRHEVEEEIRRRGQVGDATAPLPGVTNPLLTNEGQDDW